MSRPDTTVAISIAVAISLFSQVHATETAGTLQTNPFINPYIEEVETTKSQARKVPPAKELELRGTMVAGPNSQANIGGIIIAIGEDIEGYKLVSVRLRHVVLDKNGTQKMLSLDADDREPGNAQSR